MADTQPPAAPGLTGLCLRPIRGEEDAAGLRAVHEGRRVRDALDPLCISESFPSLDDLRRALAQAVAEGRQDRWQVAEVDGQIAGYGRVASWLEGDGTWVYLVLGWVLPLWRGRGIGTALLHWAEDRARELAAAEHPGEKAELAANASRTEHEAAALLQHEGYHAVYTVLEMAFDTARPLPPPTPLPRGVEVRPVRPAHKPLIAASVYEAYEREYEGGRFSIDTDLAAYAASLGDPKHDPTLWQVAWAGSEIAGQVLSAVEDGRAQVFEVSVRPAWRRQGVARGLLLRALHELRARGIDAIRLHTVAEFRTRARDLYQSVGFAPVKEFPRYRKPFS